MHSTQRVSAFALSAAVILGLGGCALLEPIGTDEPLSGMAACALGKTWNLDVADLATQVQAVLATQGIAATAITGEGTQTLDWNDKSHIVLESDYTITITTTPAADQTLVMTDKHSGKATGIAYINAETAIPRDWDASGLTVKAEALLNGAAVEALPYTPPKTELDDSVGIELTCDGGTMTTHARGSSITQKWTTGG